MKNSKMLLFVVLAGLGTGLFVGLRPDPIQPANVLKKMRRLVTQLREGELKKTIDSELGDIKLVSDAMARNLPIPEGSEIGNTLKSKTLEQFLETDLRQQGGVSPLYRQVVLVHLVNELGKKVEDIQAQFLLSEVEENELEPFDLATYKENKQLLENAITQVTNGIMSQVDERRQESRGILAELANIRSGITIKGYDPLGRIASVPGQYAQFAKKVYTKHIPKAVTYLPQYRAAKWLYGKGKGVRPGISAVQERFGSFRNNVGRWFRRAEQRESTVNPEDPLESPIDQEDSPGSTEVDLSDNQ